MNISSVITTQAKTLDQINRNISVLVSMQKKEAQAASLRERRAAAAAKRAESDKKKEKRIGAIGGTGGGDKKNKVDSKGLMKALGFAAAGAAIVGYFKSEKFRNFVNTKIFKPIGDFIGTKFKEMILSLPEKLFGKDGLFGEKNRKRMYEALFGPKGFFGKENRDKLHKFLFSPDGLFGKKNRDMVYEALLGDKGIFSPKNVSNAYKSFKSFFKVF